MQGNVFIDEEVDIMPFDGLVLTTWHGVWNLNNILTCTKVDSGINYISSDLRLQNVFVFSNTVQYASDSIHIADPRYLGTTDNSSPLLGEILQYTLPNKVYLKVILASLGLQR